MHNHVTLFVTGTYVRSVCLPECGQSSEHVLVLLAFYYSTRRPICEIKAAFSYVTVVMARYVVTRSVEHRQVTKFQKI